jgi:hypothetical protein
MQDIDDLALTFSSIGLHNHATPFPPGYTLVKIDAQRESKIQNIININHRLTNFIVDGTAVRVDVLFRESCGNVDIIIYHDYVPVAARMLSRDAILALTSIM